MKQVVAITMNNIAALPRRWGISVVVIVGVAGVVAVLTSVMTMALGLTDAATKNARDEWAIVLRKGAFAETVSAIPRGSLVAIESAAGIARDEVGELELDAHYVTSVTLPRRDDFIVSGSVLVRGLSSTGLAALPAFELLDGRLFASGKHELIVGVLAHNQFSGLTVGERLTIKGIDWLITGTFRANGGAVESELLGDITAVMAGMNSTAFSSVRVRLAESVSVDDFTQTLAADPRLKVEAKSEKEHFESGSSGNLIEFVAYVVSSIMAIGATFGALNVMYSAVSARTREIATLRALGFGPLPVAISVLIESMVLALLGGIIGLAICFALFQGTVFTSGPITSLSTVLRVTPEIAVLGLTWGSVIGFIGGLIPAIGAIRLNIVDGLRSEL